MFTNIINKQSFEFTCTAETTATSIRHQIETHTAPAINDIISAVFAEANSSKYLKIDMLEIDLGDIEAASFNREETLIKFKHLLQHRVKEIVQHQADFSVHNNEPGIIVPVEITNELEALESFLLYGILPWWIDKHDWPGADSMLQKLVKFYPEAISRLLEKYLYNTAVQVRLFTQLKPATVKAIHKLMPFFAAVSLKEYVFTEDSAPVIFALSVAQVKQLELLFKQPVKSDIRIARQLLLQQLRQLYRLLRSHKIATGKALQSDLLHEIRNRLTVLSLPGRLTMPEAALKTNITTAIKKLTIFEIDWLLFKLSLFISKNTSGDAGSFEKNLLENIVYNHYRNDTSARFYDEDIALFTGHKTGATPKTAPGADWPANEIIGNKNADSTAAARKNISGHDQQDQHHLTADGINNPNEKKDFDDPGAERKLRDKMIALVMRKLKTDNEKTFNYLTQLNTLQLQQVIASFKKRVSDSMLHKKMVGKLLDHPSLLRYNLLNFFLQLTIGGEQAAAVFFEEPFKKDLEIKNIPPPLATKLQSAQAAFLLYLQQLPVYEIDILKNIFKKGSFDTANEKKLVRKTLLKIPHQNLLLLNFIASLPAQQLAGMQAAAQTVLPGNENKPAGKKQGKTQDDNGPQKNYIENAGLCLLAPYLPSFFKELGYIENGLFKNKGFAMRAISVLQYISTGKNKNPEYWLQFNKLLCGFSIDDYITRTARLTKKETSEAESLLEAVVKNWKALRNTSPNGLRESFVKRKGILFESGQKWTLQVERKGYDVLLDTLPWGFSIIKFTWMKKFIEVEW